MPAKVCPRCGAQYQNLKSTTCPQCFAVLVAVDDATAEELAAARREVEETEEFQAVKAQDDERFKEQSFGACFAVAVMTLATLILAVILIVHAAYRHPHTAMQPTPLPMATQAQIGPLSVIPVAAATLDDVFPQQFGRYRRTTADDGTVLTGTLTPLFHAVYLRPGAMPLDVYALPAGRPTPEQNEFRLGLTLASQIGGANRPLLLFSSEYWRFAALGVPGQVSETTVLRDALIAHFQQQ